MVPADWIQNRFGKVPGCHQGRSRDHCIITTANQGQTFVATRYQEKIGDTGEIWYEIYLDEGKTQVGWASSEVIGFM